MPTPAPASPEAAPRRVVVVLGMHRSGTSLVAGCLQRAGVDFGSRLMPPNADNPRGYFEHNDVVNLHDRLLLALDRSWDETEPFAPEWWLDSARLDPFRAQLLGLLRRDFPTAPLWGLKDPRLCLLLPWWQTIWPEMSSRPLFVLVRRHPAEVAASLSRREGMSAEKAAWLWVQHTLAAERWTRGQDRVLLNFDDCLADENAALAPTLAKLGMLPTGEKPARFVDPQLGRSRMVSGESGALAPWILSVDEAMLTGWGGMEEPMCTGLDRVTQQLGSGTEWLVRSLDREITDLRHQLAQSRKQARWYGEEWQKAKGRAEELKKRLKEQNTGIEMKEKRS